jgi:urease accessory protein
VTAVRARSAVDAAATLRVDAGPDGSPVLTTLRGQVPLVPRRTGDDPWLTGRPGVTIHLVQAAAGPLAGDRLVLDLEVGPGARLTLRSAAATVALPGRADGPSRLLVRAAVGAGATLEYLPEPTVAAAGCDHRMAAEVTLAPGSTLLWREELLLGRHGESPGAVTTSLRVDLDDPGAPGGRPGTRPLLRHELALGPDAPGQAGPAVLGGARAVGTLLLAHGLWGDPELADGPGPPDGLGLAPWSSGATAVLPLAGPGALAVSLAADAVILRRNLTDAANRMIEGLAVS